MEINYLAVLVCGVVSMGLGTVWYGLLFGKQWEEIIGVKGMTAEKRAEMQKKAMPLYLVAFLFALFQAYVLAHFIEGWTDVSAIEVALWICVPFILPTVASGTMWTNDSRRIAWMRFGIQAGYYLVLFIIFGAILSAWN